MESEKEIKAKEAIKIVKIIVTENTARWQGHLLGLADDGKVYIDDHSNENGTSGWKLYVDNKLSSDLA